MAPQPVAFLLRAMLVLALCAGPAHAAVDSVVTTSAGAVRGAARDGIVVFRGIPYAAPPVGPLRWRPPQPPAAWAGVRDATRFGPICPQLVRPGASDSPQSEDCLTLNIYAPVETPAGGLPVMVWIHGGAFTQGAGSLPAYDGGAFAGQGVVLVTLNYRLDRLGRFGHPALTRAQAGEGLANYGLMDQARALEWVRDHIAAFGGDPQRVTIFGHSAGGVSVNYLMTVPAAKGLFQRAIAQSGGVSIEVTQRLREPAGRFPALEQDGLEFAASFGIADDERAPGRLRALDVAQVLAFRHENNSTNPVVDGRFVQEDVGRVFRDGRQHAVPYLAGIDSWEASLIRPLNLPLQAVLLGVPQARVREVYGPLDDRALTEAYFSDVLFLTPAWTLAGDMAAANTPAWLYYYAYVDEARRGKVPGAAHGDEVSHLFQQPRRPDDVLSAHDLEVSAPLRRYWVNFARSGDPNGADLPQWPPFRREAPAIMEFGERPVLRTTLFPERVKFHEELIRSRTPLQAPPAGR
ncbi:MAG: carboxylic ester hydrolase [Nevskiales bacterium]